MTPKTPEIIAYHPEIQVDKDGERHVLKLAVADYASEKDLLINLAKELKVQTVGEIIEAVESQKIKAAAVERPVETPTRQAVTKCGGKIWNWTEKIL